MIQAVEDEPSVVTQLGIVESELLMDLEGGGAVSLHRLVRESRWPAPLTRVALGELIRSHLARAVPDELEVMIELELPRG